MEVFDNPAVGHKPGFRLLKCRQGNTTAAKFSLEFRTIAANLRWPDDCLQTIFLRALNPDLRDELTSRGESPSFDELVRQAAHLDNTVRDHRRQRQHAEAARAMFSQGNDTEPMQVGRSPLTPTERRRRTQRGLCLYCGGAGHSLSTCPFRPHRNDPSIPVGVSSVPPTSLSQLTISVEWRGEGCNVKSLVDSGAAGNFIDIRLTHRLNLPLRKLAFPLKVHGVTGEKMMSRTIYYRTHPFVMQVGALHTETVEMSVLSQTKDPLILGLPWLRKHNPQVEWQTGEITAWSDRCLRECMSLPCKAMGVESPDPESLDVIPLDYQDVFSKEKAFRLPPHLPCDCSIELLEGVTLP